MISFPGYAETGEIPIFGTNSILPKEHGGKFFNLSIIRYIDGDVGAVANWDSSLHDSLCLNRVTPANERASLIVKAVVRLSHPTCMDLVLRKRVCFNIYKRHSLTDKIRRKMGHTSALSSLGVMYEIVSNIPKVSMSREKRRQRVMAPFGHMPALEIVRNCTHRSRLPFRLFARSRLTLSNRVKCERERADDAEEGGGLLVEEAGAAGIG